MNDLNDLNRTEFTGEAKEDNNKENIPVLVHENSERPNGSLKEQYARKFIKKSNKQLVAQKNHTPKKPVRDLNNYDSQKSIGLSASESKSFLTDNSMKDEKRSHSNKKYSGIKSKYMQKVDQI